MTESPDAFGSRHVARLLKRTGATEANVPDDVGWVRFLDATKTLLDELEQARYLLEQSLDTSSEEMQALYVELRDTAERLRREREELQRTNSLLAATLESTADGVLVTSAKGRITGFNGRFAEMWSLPDDLAECREDRVMARILAQLQDPESFATGLRTMEHDAQAYRRETIAFKDGRIFEQDSLPQRVDGEIVGRVWSFRDVTEQRRLERELSHQAFHDALTHLANRALLGDHIDQALRRSARFGGHVAVAVVDLDGFKNVNDSLGHLVGDDLLIAVANRFRSALREADTIARLGGDEFAVLFDGLEVAEEAGRLGQRILEALCLPMEVRERSVAVSASVGIAVTSDARTSPDILLGNADVAMYRAKREGKSCYRMFEPWMHTAAVERLDLEQALRRAVGERQLRVHYQPVVVTSSGLVASFEALARWYPPLREDVPPEVFIPLAEEIGLILEIGRSVLVDACQQAKEWSVRYPGISPSVAVNVSQYQLVSPGFVDDVIAALAGADLPPSLLTLEITESAFSTHPARVINVLEHVRASGVRVAIDDFGTGYSSFAALAELPVDSLKIDKRFVDNLLRDRQGRGLVTAITQLARTLGLETIAEGVETAEQRDALQALGCDYIQGFYFAQALAPGETLTYLDAESARANIA